jgi:hypothetical protein
MSSVNNPVNIREALTNRDIGVVRVARKTYTCVCASPVRRIEVWRHCEHGSTSATFKTGEQVAEHIASRRGTTCHGGAAPRNERWEVVEVPNPNHRLDCLGSIHAATEYFEYMGDAEPYGSGSRYCATCAVAVWADR